MLALAILLLTGQAVVDISSGPSALDWVVLFAIMIAAPLAAVVGWLVSRLARDRWLAVASTAAVALAGVAAVIGGGLAGLLVAGLIVVAVLALTVLCSSTATFG